MALGPARIGHHRPITTFEKRLRGGGDTRPLFVRQVQHPLDAAQSFQDAVMEFDAIDLRLAAHERGLGVLRHGGV